MSELARELGISAAQLYKWRKRRKSLDLAVFREMVI
ncbi:transposase [Chryseobacterium sp. S90]